MLLKVKVLSSAHPGRDARHFAQMQTTCSFKGGQEKKMLGVVAYAFNSNIRPANYTLDVTSNVLRTLPQKSAKLQRHTSLHLSNQGKSKHRILVAAWSMN